jgi:protein-S-isoprenylcysteine O-methyltransferase Ste14
MDAFVIDYLPWLALLIAAIRGLVVMDGLAVMFLRSKRDIHWNRSMKITFLEPFLLLFVTVYLWLYGPFAPIGAARVFLVLLGAALCVCGLCMFGWAFVAYRRVGTGHYVDDDHQIIQSGPYALVRHPMYCAAVFVWLGLANSVGDWALLTLTFAYVIPTYYFYAKEEEDMMVEALGRQYVDYAARVPMLFPRPLNVWE